MNFLKCGSIEFPEKGIGASKLGMLQFLLQSAVTVNRTIIFSPIHCKSNMFQGLLILSQILLVDMEIALLERCLLIFLILACSIKILSLKNKNLYYQGNKRTSIKGKRTYINLKINSVPKNSTCKLFNIQITFSFFCSYHQSFCF